VRAVEGREGTAEQDRAPGAQRRVVLCTSPGGVFADLMALEPWWRRHDARWFAVAAPDTRDLLADQVVTWVDEVALNRPMALVRAVVRARRELRTSPPDVVVSAGTGVAVPVFLAARSLGVPCWWVETFNMLGASGRAARICSALAQRVVVQRPELVATRRRALLVGELH
jgi:nitroreductase